MLLFRKNTSANRKTLQNFLRLFFQQIDKYLFVLFNTLYFEQISTINFGYCDVCFFEVRDYNFKK